VRELGLQLRLALLRVLLRRLRRLHLLRRRAAPAPAPAAAYLRARRAQLGSAAAAGVGVAAHLAQRLARLLLARLGGGGGGLLVVEQPLQLEVLAALHAQRQLRLRGGKGGHSEHTAARRL